MSGTVFDIGYQRYTGIREGINRARLAVFKDGLRIALGIGRGGRAKILPWFFIALLAGIAVVMVLVAGAATRMAGPEAAEKIATFHGEYYGIVSIILFIFAALGAPELLCRDRREGVINLYLVRPLTATDYLLGRWAAFLAVVLAVAWGPQILLFLGLLLDSPDPAEYLRTRWLDVPKFLAAGLALAVYTTTLAMLTASFTTRRAYASVFLVGLFVITTPFTVGLASETDGPLGQWISMFTLTNIPVHVNDIIFGTVSEMTDDAPAGELAAWIRVAWYFAWTLIPGAILWVRYRRLTP